ncbi:Rhodanese-like protein [Lichtheimia hyalospora FSU 10163]|nr:Rhodanese-like protein [Lichtheimia hyalospora FSU 10163]
MPLQYRTLAFYKFHDLSQVDLTHFRQQLLEDLGRLDIVGRVYIAKEGINAQLSCPEWRIQALRTYCNQTLKPKLGGQLMDLNFGTEESAGPAAFRALHVRIRKQLVADGLDPKSYDLANQPSHLSPAAWHEKLSKYKKTHGKDPILIDMRNHYESEIGYFEGAIRPNVDSFRGSVKSMNEICKDVPRDQEVFMYCTGGIRCSKAGAILQSASGFKQVHLVEGGITAYGRWIKEQKDKHTSLFKGRNFTFDKRMGEPITDQTSHYFNPEGPVMIDGVRAYIKKGESPDQDRIVIGKSGVKCEHDYHRRVRAIDVLGEPGDVLKQWKAAGRELPPLSTEEST